MAQYDLNNQQDRAQFGGVIVGLIGLFWLGLFVGIYVGVSPFWQRTNGGLSHFWFALWWSLPFGTLGGIVYSGIRFSRDARKTEAIEQLAAQKAALLAPQESAAQPQGKTEIGFSGLTFGVSTGELYGRDHVGGRPSGEVIHASKEDSAKNTIIFGGIGSGKTTRAINPILKQIFEQQAGALVFDIKADFSREVDYIANITGRSYLTVGHGGLTLNLIRGTTPELAASYLKSCFIASGSAGGSGAFFVDQAVELCRNSLTLLLLTDGDYSLAGLYDIVFSAERREAALAEMLEKGEAFDKRQFRLAESVGNYFANVHGTFDEKMLSNVNSTVAQVLSPFSHPDLVDAFSAGDTQGEADLTALLDGAIYFVSLPMTLFGKEGARYAYMLIKLRFFSLMRERRTRKEWNQHTPVAFVCDEYQSIIDSITDSDFWDKSRSSGCMALVSMQGVASLNHAVKDRQAADAILQNFRQRLVFRTEDDATMQMVQRLLGQVDVLITSTSDGSSTSISNTPQKDGSFDAGFAGLMTMSGPAGQVSTSQGQSYSESTSIQRQQLFDANDFRKLSTDYALFIGNLGDHAVDEVIHMQPLFVS
nr:type IV secretion system DNA-binding domain-containing protein [uncultured Aquabacterium sp.]